VQTVKDPREEREEETEQYSVLEGLRKYAANHVLLVGRPGSGKSTALAQLLFEESEKAQILLTNEKNQKRIIHIPILVELRYCKTSIVDLILKFLKRHELIINNSKLDDILLGKTNVIPLLLFDGLNELSNDNAREEVKDFLRENKKISMVFTTRDIEIGGDFNIEKKLEMLPLNQLQMQQFVLTYFPEVGERVLRELGTRLKEFGETPLLLWMICFVFAPNGEKIPTTSGLLFHEFAKKFDKKKREKESAKIPEKLRRWQKRLLQQLAWVMTEGETRTEQKLSISKDTAEKILIKFLDGKIEYSEDIASEWLEYLINYYLIQVTSDGEEIEFCHQAIQEYYAAEALLEKLEKKFELRDEELQWNYLNYLKWTEPFALMLGMIEKKDDAINIIKLALAVDVRLGAILAGKVKKEWQKDTIFLVDILDKKVLLKVKLLGYTNSGTAVKFLEKHLIDKSEYIRFNAVEAIGDIRAEESIRLLCEYFEKESLDYIQIKIIESLEKIGDERVLPFLEQVLSSDNYFYCYSQIINTIETIGVNDRKNTINVLLKCLKKIHPDDLTYYRVIFILTQITKTNNLLDALEYLNNNGFNANEVLSYEELKKRKRENRIYGLIYGIPYQRVIYCSLSYSPLVWLQKKGEDRSIHILRDALLDPDDAIRRTAAYYLSQDIVDSSKNENEIRIELLFEFLKNEEKKLSDNKNSLSICHNIHNILYGIGEIGNLKSISQLQNLFFLSDNLVNRFNQSLWDITYKIQQRLGSYTLKKASIMTNQQVYISYNWQEDSNEIANQIVQAFEAKGIEVIRDKTHTSYKDSIKKFMQQIGQGQCVIAVISDRYLKSPNCMFELVEITKVGDFYNRIFPIILPDTKFYKAIDRLNYTQYWDEQIKELEIAMKSGSLANLQGITDELNLYTEIRSRIASLTDTLKDMNTLTLDLHRESEFTEMIQAVEAKLAEDSQNNSVSPSHNPTSFPQSITYDLRGANIGNFAHKVQGNQHTNQQEKS
jgi:HEAT repeat protein